MTEELDFDAESARLIYENYRKNTLRDYLYRIKENAINGWGCLFVEEDISPEIIQELKNRKFEIEHTYNKDNTDKRLHYIISWVK